MAGRPRKPTQQKVIEGTFRKDRALNEPNPEVPSDIKVPDVLTTKAERKLYVRLAEQLRPSGLFTVADEMSLVSLVRVEIKTAQLGKQIKLKLLEGATGGHVADPRLPAYRDLLKIATDLRRGFGMDPASRSKIDLPESGEDEGDGMADILAGAG